MLYAISVVYYKLYALIRLDVYIHPEDSKLHIRRRENQKSHKVCHSENSRYIYIPGPPICGHFVEVVIFTFAIDL
jgi:hypothetical protein